MCFSLILYVFLVLFLCLFFRSFIFLLRRDREEMDLDGRQGEEKLGQSRNCNQNMLYGKKIYIVNKEKESEHSSFSKV